MGVLGQSIVGTYNFFIVSTFGQECGFTSLEATVLIPSVQRSLERLPKEQAEKAAIFIDPILIVTVLLMQGRRIVQIKRREAVEKYSVRPEEAMRAAGISGFEYNAAQAAANGAPPEQPQNGTYATPDPIRKGFDDAI